MPAFRPHTTGTTDAPYDGAEMERRVRTGEKRDYYAKVFAWYDPDKDEGNKGTYRFKHHMLSEDGMPGDANTNVCSTDIGVLNGGRGGTTIPAGDRQAVYDHLAKHLRDAGKEPPDLKKESELPGLAWSEIGQSESSEMLRSELFAYAAGEVWAILSTWLHASLSKPIAPHIAQDELLAVTRPGPKSGRVARVPIIGPITKRDSLFSLFFGGISVERLKATVQEVMTDDTISTVLLDVDSPGGTAAGITELTAELRRLAESKHVVALANHMMASAAYWIAAQADEIVATPDALIGSVGVFAVHADFSQMLERIGIKPTYIAAGKYKTEGNPDEPLSDEARDHIQRLVDEAYELFVADVAQGRGITPAAVRAEYGEGRILTARDAKAAGMIDRIAGADETIRKLVGAKASAEGAIDSPMAREHADQARLAQLRRRLAIAEKL